MLYVSCGHNFVSVDLCINSDTSFHIHVEELSVKPLFGETVVRALIWCHVIIAIETKYYLLSQVFQNINITLHLSQDIQHFNPR